MEPGKWVWLKIKQEGQTAGLGPCFHLQRFHFGTGFLSHSQMKPKTKSCGLPLLSNFDCHTQTSNKTKRLPRTCPSAFGFRGVDGPTIGTKTPEVVDASDIRQEVVGHRQQSLLRPGEEPILRVIGHGRGVEMNDKGTVLLG